MKVTLENRQSDLPIHESSVETLVREVLCFHQIQTDEIIINFVTEEEITKLHGEFFDDPTPTDCITFPIDPPFLEKSIGPSILGELCICPKAALDYSPISPYEELSLYVVHGILHLLGYDDIDPEEEKKMRLAEQETLSHLYEKKCVLSIVS